MDVPGEDHQPLVGRVRGPGTGRRPLIISVDQHPLKTTPARPLRVRRRVDLALRHPIRQDVAELTGIPGRDRHLLVGSDGLGARLRGDRGELDRLINSVATLQLITGGGRRWQLRTVVDLATLPRRLGRTLDGRARGRRGGGGGLHRWSLGGRASRGPRGCAGRLGGCAGHDSPFDVHVRGLDQLAGPCGVGACGIRRIADPAAVFLLAKDAVIGVRGHPICPLRTHDHARTITGIAKSPFPWYSRTCMASQGRARQDRARLGSASLGMAGHGKAGEGGPISGWGHPHFTAGPCPSVGLAASCSRLGETPRDIRRRSAHLSDPIGDRQSSAPRP